jgi:transposase
LAGLSNRRGAPRARRLDAGQVAELVSWLEAGPDPKEDGVVRWRRQDLQRRIAVRFEVELHERTVGKYLAALGYRRLSVRPHHPRVDPEVQATFKKNFAETIDAALPEAARGNRSRSGSRTRRGSARRAR